MNTADITSVIEINGSEIFAHCEVASLADFAPSSNLA
jgi:hypothetical protein